MVHGAHLGAAAALRQVGFNIKTTWCRPPLQRSRILPTRREKGAGRGVKREHDEDDDEDERHPKGRGKGVKSHLFQSTKGARRTRSRSMRVARSSARSARASAGTTSASARVASPFGHEHRCDVLLQQGSVCASSSHTRLEHNSGWQGGASYL